MRRLALLFLLVPRSFPAAAQPYRWDSVAFGGGGFVTGIVAHPGQKNLFYARTDVGGAYRWEVETQSWTPLLDWVSEEERGYMGVESLALDPQDPNRLYLLAGTSYFNGGKTAVLRSGDQGRSFEVVDVTAQFKAHGNGMGRQSGEKLAVDPRDGNHLLCGTRWKGLWGSLDAGRTWTKKAGFPVETTPNENGISFVRFGPGVILAGVSRAGDANLFQSLDGGETWKEIKGGPRDLMPQRSALTPDGKFLVTYANGAGPHGHWKLPEPMDRGALWEFDLRSGKARDISPQGFTRPFAGIDVFPQVQGRVIASTINTWQQQSGGYGDALFVSRDNGASWQNLIGGKYIPIADGGRPWIRDSSIHWTGCFTADPFDSKRAFVVSGNGVFLCENLDSKPPTWTFASKGMEETVVQDMISIPGGPNACSASDVDGWLWTDPSRPSVAHQPRTGSCSAIAVASKDPRVMARAGKQLFLSSNGGQDWSEIPLPSKASGGRLALSADGRVLLYAPEKEASVYKSRDRGQTWSSVQGLTFTGAAPVADTVNPLKVYAYDQKSGAFFASSDGGSSFAKTASLDKNGSRLIRALPGRDGDIWVPLHEGGLSRSQDGGKSFARLPGLEGCGSVGFGAAAPGSSVPAIYVWGRIGGITGIFRSIDEGQSWLRINDDAHEFGGPGNGDFVMGDMNVFGRVYMSTVGRGLVCGELATIDRQKLFRHSVGPFTR